MRQFVAGHIIPCSPEISVIHKHCPGLFLDFASGCCMLSFFLISILDDYLTRFASYFFSSFHGAQIGLVCWKQPNVCVLNQTNGRNFVCQDLRLVVLLGFDILQGSGCRAKGEESCQPSAAAEECICNIWCATSAYWMNCWRTWVLRLFWGSLISLASAENQVDFNIAKQSHVANPKHPFLFMLKNLSMNKQRVCLIPRFPGIGRWG